MATASDPSFSVPRGILAVLDSSVLVRGWLSSAQVPNPLRRVMLLAGVVYDSFTSPAIVGEVEEVLTRPRIGADPDQVFFLSRRTRATSSPASTYTGGDSPPRTNSCAFFVAESRFPAIVREVDTFRGSRALVVALNRRLPAEQRAEGDAECEE